MNDRRARLFVPLLDPVDMVMCCPADATLDEVNARVRSRQLRFPLGIEPAATVRAHVAAAEYAPGSARFGPFVDNILGMNWALPGGRMVRVGERVIKSTTGYDLMRFLLHTDGRYGRAVDYVLRLRPAGGATAACVLTGDTDALDRVRRAVLRSPWLHWLDICSVEFLPDRDPCLHLAADCAPGEEAAFAGFFARLAADSGAGLAPEADLPPGLPALECKTVVSAAVPLAAQLVREHGGWAQVLCANGVVHYHPSGGPALPADLLAGLVRQCTAQGGHVFGAAAPAVLPDQQERHWAGVLESAWNRL